ncbi:MAG: CHAT domain-containing protein [Cyanobacteria bacterium SBC]|nr:CHAT domain-containing protein [Cyanobacteria bacterium SBC]
MAKLVVLKFTGDLEGSGFHVSLEVGSESQRPTLETTGFLPPSPSLADCLQQHWHEAYRSVGSPWNHRILNGLEPCRIRPKRITYNGAIERLQACQQSAKLVETNMRAWLKSPSFREVELRLREALSREDEIRVLVRSDCTVVRKLPWHLWDFVRRYPNAEVSLSPLAVATQNFETCHPPKARVKILAILGHSDGIDVDRDREFLEQLDRADVTFLVEPKRQDIHDRLWEQAWDIVFFAGHSETEEETGKIYINPDESLSLEDLWYGLRKAVDRGLKLAIFNSCDGLGLARSLDDCQIPQIVVMRELVPDRVAQAFLKYFLDAFSQGDSLYSAVRAARERLQGLEDRFPCASWLPTIVQNPHAVPPRWTDLFEVDPTPRPTSVGEMMPFTSERFSNSLSNVPSPTTTSIDRGKISFLRFLGVSLASVALYFAIAPPFANWLNHLGEKALMSERWQQSKHYFQWSLRVYPYSAAALANLGFLYEDTQELDLARKYYHRAMLRGNAAGCNNEARLDLEAGHVDRAAKLLKQCWRIVEPDNQYHQYAILKNRGHAHLKLEDYEAAEDYLMQAIRLMPDGGAADCLLARVWEAQGRQQDALEPWLACYENASDYYYEEEQWKRQAERQLRAAGIALPKQ